MATFLFTVFLYNCSGVMVVLSINTNYQQYNYSTGGIKQANSVNKPQTGSCASSLPVDKTYNVPFGSAMTSSQLRTTLSTKEEKEKYKFLTKTVDKTTRKELNKLLKSGILLKNDSNDHSSVLDNLHKIATTPRAEGLDNAVILKETIDTIANPYLITQQFGDIPEEFQDKALKLYAESHPDFNPDTTNLIEKGVAKADINLEHSGTCVAASIEFNMAQKHPAEFSRFVENLTSPKLAVEKTIKLKNLADNVLDTVWLLNAFEIPFTADNFNEVKLTFAPDKNAILRAQIQNSHRDPGERSVIDVLMQSTLMQTGSQQTYDTLTDTRGGKFNQNNKGLIEFEKTFTESVVEDKNKISMTYQTVDENGRITGYETDFNTMKRQIISALAAGENVIIGYTQTDETNKIINGHEITITGVQQDNKGKLMFICNDTDDDYYAPIAYSEDYLLPKIHHAALPQQVVGNDVNIVENWVEGLKSYKEIKRQAA